MSYAVTSPKPTNGGWRTAALSTSGALLLAIIGWFLTDSSTARAKMADDIAVNAQRIAVLEESNRNMRASQDRIEKVLEEIRREMQQGRR